MMSRQELVKNTAVVFLIVVVSLIGRFVLQIQVAGITFWLGLIALWLCGLAFAGIEAERRRDLRLKQIVVFTGLLGMVGLIVAWYWLGS